MKDTDRNLLLACSADMSSLTAYEGISIVYILLKLIE